MINPYTMWRRQYLPSPFFLSFTFSVQWRQDHICQFQMYTLCISRHLYSQLVWSAEPPVVIQMFRAVSWKLIFWFQCYECHKYIFQSKFWKDRRKNGVDTRLTVWPNIGAQRWCSVATLWLQHKIQPGSLPNWWVKNAPYEVWFLIIWAIFGKNK